MTDGIKDVFLAPAHLHEGVESFLRNGLRFENATNGVDGKSLMAGIERNSGNVRNGCVELVLCVAFG